MSEDELPLDQETLIVSYALFMLICEHHAEHEGEPLVLTAEQVCDLAGCALGYEYAGQRPGE